MLQRIKNLISSLIVQTSPRKIFQIGSSHVTLMRSNYLKVKDINELE